MVDTQQRETYLAFRKLKDQEEALEFLKERVPSPVGKPYFTPSNYRWCTMPLVTSLEDSHKGLHKSANGLAGFFALIIFTVFLGLPLLLGAPWWVVVIVSVIGAVISFVSLVSVGMQGHKEDASFSEMYEMALSAYVENMDTLTDWVSSRYAIPGDSYLIPDKFAYMDEEGSGGEAEWEADFGPTYDSDEILYSWEKVEPTQMSLGDEQRTHCILVYKNTQMEAPLLPGVKSYSN